VPFPQDNHALLAIQVAFKMQSVHKEVMRLWAEKGIVTTPVGIGIATGEVRRPLSVH
jgi:hypothetical protein